MALFQLSVLTVTAFLQPDFEIWANYTSKALPLKRPQISEERPHGPVIIGVGKLEYRPDPANFDVNRLTSMAGRNFVLELGVQPDGSISSCLDMKGWAKSIEINLAEIVCSDIRKNAKFAFVSDYRLVAPVGYLPVSFSWSKREFVAQPVSFLSEDNGLEIKGEIDLVGEKKVRKCSIWGNSLSEADKVSICQAVPDTASFRSRISEAAAKSYGYGAGFTAWVAPKDPKPEPVSIVRWNESRYYSAYGGWRRYKYPNAFPKDAQFFKDNMGKFVFNPSLQKLPRNLRGDYGRGPTGGQIIVAINPDGSVASCRPVIESGVAGADLKACELAEEEGRFIFNTNQFNIGQYTTEVRYLVSAVVWN